MMSYYYVKSPLFGIAAGKVERFSDVQAGRFLLEGSIEPFDPRKHRSAPGAECVPGVEPASQAKPLKH